jgi:hypothetical protein
MARKPIEHDNNLVTQYLAGIVSYSHACEIYCFFDDIATGTACLDAGNNTRPLSRRMLLDLIQTLPVISTKAVQHRTGVSVGHAQKLALFARVLSKAFEMQVRDYREIPSITAPADYINIMEFAAEDRKEYLGFLLKRFK